MKTGRYVTAKKKARKPLVFRVLNKHIKDTDNVVGQCWPASGDHIIEIDPRQCPKEYLDTLIHESIHELFPKIMEKTVLHAGTTIANLLWRLGYRRVRARA